MVEFLIVISILLWAIKGICDYSDSKHIVDDVEDAFWESVCDGKRPNSK